MDAWNILVVVVLALILLLILPMVAARNGSKSFTQALMAPLHRKKKRGPLGLEVEPEKKPERHVNNSMQGELTAIVSQLITFTKRQHYTLVYPGTIQESGQLTTTLALVVTPGGVVGLNCFGFAGEIHPATSPMTSGASTSTTGQPHPEPGHRQRKAAGAAAPRHGQGGPERHPGGGDRRVHQQGSPADRHLGPEVLRP